MAENIACRDCLHFVKDRIGDGAGIGRCGVLEAYKQKQPGVKQIRLALIQLGNRPDDDAFWGGSLKNRTCEKYEPGTR